MKQRKYLLILIGLLGMIQIHAKSLLLLRRTMNRLCHNGLVR